MDFTNIKTQFERIYFDITGNCNAKCPWCISGRYAPEINKNFITPELFDKALNALKENNAVAPAGIIALYVWGEPFIHPKLPELIKIINEYKYRYAFSTNASKIPLIDKSFIKNLDHIIFSMPGFSQHAYDREHGLKFDKVKNNIKTIINECKKNGYKGHFIISYHVYQFNLEELPECEKWANQMNIIFSPAYAIINNWWHVNSWIDGTLSYEVLKRIAEDLFCFDIERKLKESPKDYFCKQYNLLAIDEKANVLNCCQVPKDPQFLQGNLITDNFKEILQKRIKNDICKKCTLSGLAYYLNNSLTPPKFYKRPLIQKIRKFDADCQLLIQRCSKDPSYFLKFVQKKLNAHKTNKLI